MCSQARFLRYLDVSENSIDKRAAEYLVQAITPSTTSISSPASQSLLALYSTPSINFNSLPLAPDTAPEKVLPIDESTEKVEIPIAEEVETENPFYDGGDDDELGPLFTVAPLLKEDSSLEVGTVLSLRMENCGLKGQALEILGKL